MSLAIKVLVALVAGLALGLGIAASGSTAFARVVPVLEPVGTLWVAAIRMTIIPLVMASLIVGVGGAPDPRAIGKIGVRAIGLFVAMLTVATLFAVLVGPPALGFVQLDPAAVEALRASAAQTAGAAVEGAKRIPTAAQWIVDLVPVNPVKAAADGAMLPLIVFSLAFGVAVTRVAAERRAVLLRVTEAVREASLVLVHAILVVAPVGVFALAVSVAAKLGLAAVGALAAYVVVVCSATTIFVAFVLYPAAVVLGSVPLRTFARGALPAQAVAISARSSLAALPAMLEGARERLGLPEPLAGFLLPLAVSLFRVGAAIGQVIGALFIATLYGVTLGPAQLAAVGATTIATNFSIPGIPNGSILMIVPVLLAAGVPAEGVGLLLAVDTIPDMFRTTTNVTGDLVAAVILGRREVGAPTR
ncbi:MAG TPA: dicarboxylate/amino acid:cation symporter [Gemmatimonadaceae bacterium]|nr:dicarboxylate/amino acid:cation symporter [Gemmatimonadaceae bacterium]